MSDLLKAALILSAAILLAICIRTYFSPYHSCVRAYEGEQTAVRGRALCRVSASPLDR